MLREGVCVDLINILFPCVDDAATMASLLMRLCLLLVLHDLSSSLGK